MKKLDPIQAAREAVSANPVRPATAIIHDSADARCVVFRLEPGQQVAPHTSPSSVLLLAVEGSGVVTTAEGDSPLAVGEAALYEPRELHGMRAVAERFVLLAVITPQPGSRA
ncbi:MAG TPA: cupin domain-containing protein [Gemmatimonadaceae bacterium]